MGADAARPVLVALDRVRRREELRLGEQRWVVGLGFVSIRLIDWETGSYLLQLLTHSRRRHARRSASIAGSLAVARSTCAH